MMTERLLSSVLCLGFFAQTHNNLLQKTTYAVSKFDFSRI